MLQNERLGPASAIWRLGVHGLSERDGLRHDQLQAQLSGQGGPLTPAKVGSVWLRAESNAPPVS